MSFGVRLFGFRETEFFRTLDPGKRLSRAGSRVNKPGRKAQGPESGGKMDIIKMLAELREEHSKLAEAIQVLERLAGGHGKRRGRPPGWMSKLKRTGRPPGSKNKAKAAAATA